MRGPRRGIPIAITGGRSPQLFGLRLRRYDGGLPLTTWNSTYEANELRPVAVSVLSLNSYDGVSRVKFTASSHTSTHILTTTTTMNSPKPHRPDNCYLLRLVLYHLQKCVLVPRSEIARVLRAINHTGKEGTESVARERRKSTQSWQQCNLCWGAMRTISQDRKDGVQQT